MIPLARLPPHILLQILQKIKFVSWFTLRRTCSFIYNLVLQEHKYFRMQYSNRQLIIKYKPKSKKLNFFLKRESQNYRAKFKNITSKAVTTLPGIVFGYVIIKPVNHSRYSAMHWFEFQKAMTAFAEKTSLSCDILQICTRFKHFPTIMQFFQSIKRVDVNCYGADEEYLRGRDRTEVVTLDYASEILNNPKLKHVDGLSVHVNGGYGKLISLFDRFETLSIKEDWMRVEDYCLWEHANGMMREIYKGRYRNQMKFIRLRYFSKTENYFVQGEWKTFPELEHVDFTLIWDHQHFDNSLRMGGSDKFFLVDTTACTAICYFSLRSDILISEVTVEVYILPSFNAFEIFDFLFDNVIPWRRPIDGSVLMECIEKRDWTALKETIDSI